MLVQDPREYLPFLRELRALSKYYQRFRIDDHLRRYDKALRNLSVAGDVAHSFLALTDISFGR
jgi:elongator complex protein 1